MRRSISSANLRALPLLFSGIRGAGRRHVELLRNQVSPNPRERGYAVPGGVLQLYNSINHPNFSGPNTDRSVPPSAQSPELQPTLGTGSFAEAEILRKLLSAGGGKRHVFPNGLPPTT